MRCLIPVLVHAGALFGDTDVCDAFAVGDGLDYLHTRAVATGKPPGATGVSGLYMQAQVAVDDPFFGAGNTRYETTDESWRLELSDLGGNVCSGRVKRGSVAPSGDCVDDQAAANELFGNTAFGGWVHGLDSNDPNICGAAAQVGYCRYSFFAAVCAASCETVCNADPDECTARPAEVCLNNDDTALADLYEMLGREGTRCHDAAVAGGCEDLLSVTAICKADCRHSAHVAGHHAGESLSLPEFRSYYPERRLFRWGATGRQLAADRRLAPAHVVTYDDVFVLTSGEKNAEAGAEHWNNGAVFADHVDAECDDTGKQWCDPTKVGAQDKKVTVSEHCDKVTAYQTYSYAFCPWVNIDMAGHPKSCFAQGKEEDFHSNAICADRETCEDLCTADETCTSIDMVLGEDKCWLNREHDELCTKDQAWDDGVGGLPAPDGWTRVEQYGTVPGRRYPDGHVPPRRLQKAEQKPGRRLAHQKLWQSETHVFIRKVPDATTAWRTRSKRFCVAKNVNNTAIDMMTQVQVAGNNTHPEMGLALDQTCSNKCVVDPTFKGCYFNVASPTTALDDEDVVHFSALTDPMSPSYIAATDPDYARMLKDEAFCADRETCERLCEATDDCVSFDMHKFLPRCWLNLARCGQDGMADEANHLDAQYHDLVEREHADACRVTISGSANVDGVYVHDGDAEYNFEPFVLKHNQFKCMWTVHDIETGALASHLGFVDDRVLSVDEDGVATHTYDPEGARPLFGAGACSTGWTFNDAAAVNAVCPKEDLDYELYCAQEFKCEALQYCMVSTERLDYELTLLGKTTGQDMLCNDVPDVVDAIEQYEPKIVADEARVEAVFNSAAFDDSTDGHYLHQELFRDGADFRVRVQSLGDEFTMGIVSLANPADAHSEFGGAPADYVPPAGFRDWASDVMRFERYNTTGGAVFSGLTVELYLPQFADHVRRLDTEEDHGEKPVVMQQTADGWKALLEAKLEPSELHHEEGWIVVRIPADTPPTTECPCRRAALFPQSRGTDCPGSIVLAVTSDLNECADDGHRADGAKIHECVEGEVCRNCHMWADGAGDAGCMNGYSCHCSLGMRRDAKGNCVAEAWMAEHLSVRVENDSPLNLGWRVKEVTLYEDGNCEKPLLEVGDWYWSKLDDSYCVGHNEGRPSNLRSNSCKSKCSKGYQSTGDCRGYMNVDARSDHALCVERERCFQICGELDNCEGIDMHETLPRCYLNMAGGRDTCEEQALDASKRGADVHYDLYVKGKLLATAATSQFHEHPPRLVTDSSMHSEWWTGGFRVEKLGEHLELKVSPLAHVRSVKVHQVQGYASEDYRVHIGPTKSMGEAWDPHAGKARRLHEEAAEYKHVQDAEAGATLEDRHATKTVQVKHDYIDEPQCVNLDCGEPRMHYNPEWVLQAYEDVPSPCHCKQMCLDQVFSGCQSYAFHKEEDTNYWYDPAFHTHHTCYLLSEPFAKGAGRPSGTWVSGSIDLVLLDATFANGQITVTGAGLPAETTKQRIKVVKESESCEAEPTPEVGGLSCSSPFVCHPGPAEATSSKASWDVTWAQAAEDTEYKVCYCAGVCFSAGQWTSVPAVIQVGQAGLHFKVPEGLTAHQDTFELTTPAGAGAQPTLYAVNAGDRCDDANALGWFTAGKDGCLDGVCTYEVSLNAGGRKYGNYTVCTNVDDEGVALAGEHGPFLELEPVYPLDAIQANGIFSDAGSYSAAIGEEATLRIQGARMTGAAFENARARVLSTGTCGAPGDGTALPDLGDLEPTDESTDAEVVFQFDVADDFTAGSYAVCFRQQGETDWESAGKLHVTARADIGKTFVLDPDAESYSLEITGKNLDFHKDRLMVVNCQDTCGEAPGSQFVSGTEAAAVADYLDDPQAEFQIPEQPYSIDMRYTEDKSRYCSGHNIMGGNAQVTDNLCFNKCETDVPCTGANCYCDGYFQGFDDTSGALCLPRNECEHLCSLLGDACVGVDMHKTLNRCFLNSNAAGAGGSCYQQRRAGTLGVDTSYNFLFKSLDQGAPARKLVHVDWESSHRGNLALKPGVSTRNNLRFTNLGFSSAGTFKVCFCDSALSGQCESKSDYTIEVGKVHVSGVHCLLSIPKLRRQECYEQYYGGLSCGAYTLPEDVDGNFPDSEGIVGPGP